MQEVVGIGWELCVSVSCSEVSVKQVDLLQTKAKCWPRVCCENLVKGYEAKEITNYL